MGKFCYAFNVTIVVKVNKEKTLNLFKNGRCCQRRHETEIFLLSGFEKTFVQQCLGLFKESLNILLELISMEPSFSSKSSVQKRCMMNLTQEFYFSNYI